MNTQVCTTKYEGSAWQVASKFWCCGGSFHDYLCAFCLPCQLGAIESKSENCPSTARGCAICTLASCPCIHLCVAAVVVDDYNGQSNACCDGKDIVSACLWLSLAPCTCAHCAIADYATNPSTYDGF